MPLTNVFVAVLDHPPGWREHGGERSVREGRLCPYFPWIGRGHGGSRDAWSTVLSRQRSGEWQSRQIDWGAVAVKASKQQILDLIEESYAGVEQPQSFISPESERRHQEGLRQLEALRACAAALADGEDYALICIEEG